MDNLAVLGTDSHPGKYVRSLYCLFVRQCVPSEESPLEEFLERVASVLPPPFEDCQKNASGVDEVRSRVTRYSFPVSPYTPPSFVTMTLTRTRHFGCEKWISELTIDMHYPADELRVSIDALIGEDKRIDF